MPFTDFSDPLNLRRGNANLLPEFTNSFEFFIQDTWRIRNPQLVRLNFSYRFGKMDASLFKRKNTRISTEGMDMM